jgi:hypothetical protein
MNTLSEVSVPSQAFKVKESAVDLVINNDEKNGDLVH